MLKFLILNYEMETVIEGVNEVIYSAISKCSSHLLPNSRFDISQQAMNTILQMYRKNTYDADVAYLAVSSGFDYFEGSAATCAGYYLVTYGRCIDFNRSLHFSEIAPQKIWHPGRAAPSLRVDNYCLSEYFSNKIGISQNVIINELIHSLLQKYLHYDRITMDNNG